MVVRRERFQRVYELAEKVLHTLDPPLEPAHAALSIAALRQRFIVDSVRALGVTTAAWIADYYRLKPSMADSELLAVSVDGWVKSG